MITARMSGCAQEDLYVECSVCVKIVRGRQQTITARMSGCAQENLYHKNCLFRQKSPSSSSGLGVVISFAPRKNSSSCVYLYPLLPVPSPIHFFVHLLFMLVFQCLILSSLHMHSLLPRSQYRKPYLVLLD